MVNFILLLILFKCPLMYIRIQSDIVGGFLALFLLLHQAAKCAMVMSDIEAFPRVILGIS